ncbi:MAG: hypothetical protein I8H72_00310 [Myxococcaceae bacterium]|nr:hypothetical protein [Myxococcaceae bacterium]
MVLSLFNTIYFTLLNSNNQVADIHQWTLDSRGLTNIVWNTMIYGWSNKLETSYIPEQNERIKTLANVEQIQAIQEGIAQAKWWVNCVGSTSPMLTLNTNMTMLEERFYERKLWAENHGVDSELSNTVGFGLLFLSNVGFFYIVPPLLKSINHRFFSTLPSANWIAEKAFSKIPSKIVACAVFSGVSATYQEILISIKHLANQWIPQPNTLSIARFDDCTRCWFGTNLFGKNGPIGSYLSDWRQAFLDFMEEPIGADPESNF